MRATGLVLLLGAGGASAYGVAAGCAACATTRAAVAPLGRAALVAQAGAGGAPMAGPPTTIRSDETYGLMLSTLLKTNESIAGQIAANYAMVDYAFLERLEAALAEGDAATAARLREIKEAVTDEMSRRMGAAAEAMRDLVQSPTAIVMEGKIAGLARQGRLDDALLQLLQANLEQAQAAGEAGAGAAAVLTKLLERVRDELDQKLPPEVSILRRLLRMDDPDSRKKLLREKMTPKAGASVLLAGVSKEEEEAAKSTAPDISPRQMAEAIKDVKLRFGNVDEAYDTGFVSRLEQIAEEAESIALDLAGGKEVSPQQAQDMAWNDASISVWDLAQVEEEAHQDGKLAVWEEEAQAQMAREDSAMRQSSIERDFGAGGA
jgi:hypothetical protein